mmetsp:Transcript_4412/g.11053  ORF Transcript_4412/g.11053 Transcript_4412/m.11053 type:complete len:410 (+) Transcript_4412:35-1264(+)|eukprot:CAMPEP_0206229360 /NCGR_PEP_ID=MMETSP0047_2-20121206/9658_1 /ASSEMBLY_ACC=CAM_ASM_000192 /TAXON_ID=195065 /ORGANISM="Chroomonas mesostigmatica_cf, Strain CCMP1168" /LENGTH=409 /DNA_ID=CAMNT_0053652659 /DNA_START=10 /DNA_END=1239 /DNA_ORIENTATION=-
MAPRCLLAATAALVAVAHVSAFAPSASLLGRAPALRGMATSPRVRPAGGLRMGLFDGLTDAIKKGMETPAPEGAGSSELDDYTGFILKEGMRSFTFDNRMSAPIGAVGSYSIAGQRAPSGAAAAAPKPQGWSPFGFLQASGNKIVRANKENQDGIIVKPNLYDGVSLFCVFDGHGDNGADISEWAENNLPIFMTEALKQGRAGELLNRITDAYRQCDAKLTEDFGYEFVEDSGTTVATVLIKGDLMLVAGLGDSRVVMGLEEEGSLGAQALTLDQSPNVAAERKRIEAAGGEVRGEGPVGRVYAAGQKFPGLAISRAFGDADGKKIGVTCDPQFIGWKIRQDCDWVVVAASDGVWNAIGNENVIEICSRYRDTKNAEFASKEIVETARKVWEAVAKGRIDDITATVIFL